MTEFVLLAPTGQLALLLVAHIACVEEATIGLPIYALRVVLGVIVQLSRFTGVLSIVLPLHPFRSLEATVFATVGIMGTWQTQVRFACHYH